MKEESLKLKIVLSAKLGDNLEQTFEVGDNCKVTTNGSAIIKGKITEVGKDFLEIEEKFLLPFKSVKKIEEC